MFYYNILLHDKTSVDTKLLSLNFQCLLLCNVKRKFDFKIMIFPFVDPYFLFSPIIVRIHIQWNLSNPTHQGTREMCRILQDVVIIKFYFN